MDGTLNTSSNTVEPLLALLRQRAGIGNGLTAKEQKDGSILFDVSNLAINPQRVENTLCAMLDATADLQDAEGREFGRHSLERIIAVKHDRENHTVTLSTEAADHLARAMNDPDYKDKMSKAKLTPPRIKPRTMETPSNKTLNPNQHDFSGRTIENEDFSGWDFLGKDFSGTTFENCSLIGAKHVGCAMFDSGTRFKGTTRFESTTQHAELMAGLASKGGTIENSVVVIPAAQVSGAHPLGTQDVEPDNLGR